MADRWEEPEFLFDHEAGESGVIWRNKRDPRLTVEYHPLVQEEFEEGEPIPDEPIVNWYVFPAYDGRGIPNSPMIVDNEDEAEKVAENLKSMANLRIFTWSTYDNMFRFNKARGRSRTIVLPRTMGQMLEAKKQHVRRHVRRAR